MSTEKLVKQVGYLRKSGGFSLTVSKQEGTFLSVGFFKDIGSYGTTVSFAAESEDLEASQAACIEGLASLVKYTEESKPVKPAPASSGSSYSGSKAPAGSAVVSLKGLKDNQFQSAKEVIKQAGFRFDMESKDWVGGDASQLPDWLQKRVKGNGASFSSSNGNGFKKPYQKPAVEAVVESASEDDIPFGSNDELGW